MAKNKLDAAGIYKVKPTVLYRLDNEKEIVVLNLEDQSLYSIEGLSGYIWILLDGTKTVDEIVSLCSKELKIAGKTLRPKILKVIEDIFLKNLIEPIGKKEKPKDLAPGLKKIFLKNKISTLKPVRPVDFMAAAGSSAGSAGGGTAAGSTIGGAGPPGSGSYSPPSPP